MLKMSFFLQLEYKIISILFQKKDHKNYSILLIRGCGMFDLQGVKEYMKVIYIYLLCLFLQIKRYTFL